ncbi:hypothetical protein GEMRC1_012576 [Eukaryota sp. GEM-RC1]
MPPPIKQPRVTAESWSTDLGPLEEQTRGLSLSSSNFSVYQSPSTSTLPFSLDLPDVGEKLTSSRRLPLATITHNNSKAQSKTHQNSVVHTVCPPSTPVVQAALVQRSHTPIVTSVAPNNTYSDVFITLTPIEITEMIHAWSYYSSQETVYTLPPDYHKNSISSKYRARLLDWMVDIHCSLNLERDSLHRSVTLIDRFCFLKAAKNGAKIPDSKLTLVFIASLFICSKFSDRNSPMLKELMEVSDLTKEQILHMEFLILDCLQWDLSHPTVETFTKILLYVIRVPDKVRYLCHYLLELFMLSNAYCAFPASTLSLAMISIACRLSNVPFSLGSLTNFPITLPLKKVYDETVAVVLSNLVKVERVSKLIKLSASFRKYDSGDKYWVSSMTVAGLVCHS